MDILWTSFGHPLDIHWTFRNFLSVTFCRSCTVRPKLADELQQKCGAVGSHQCRLIHDPLPHWEAMVKNYGNMLSYGKPLEYNWGNGENSTAFGI